MGSCRVGADRGAVVVRWRTPARLCTRLCVRAVLLSGAVQRCGVHCIFAVAGGCVGGWRAKWEISELAKDFSVHIGFSFVWP